MTAVSTARTILLTLALLAGVTHRAPGLEALPPAGAPEGEVRRACPGAGQGGDDTACLQGVVDRLCGAIPGGGRIALSAGQFRIGTLVISCGGLTLEGVGPGDGERSGTTLRLLPGAQDGIRVAGPFGGPRLKGIRIASLRVEARERTDGAAIAFDGVEHGAVADVVLAYPHDGVRLGAGLHYAVSHVLMDQVRHTGFVLEGTFPPDCSDRGNIADCPFRQDVVSIEDVFMGSALGREAEMTGIEWSGFSATLNIRNVQIVNPNVGIAISCRTGEMAACPHFLNGWNLEVDFARLHAIRAADFQEIKCFLCYFNGLDAKTGPLLTFANERLAGSSGVQLIGGKALGSGEAVIDIAVQNARIADMDIYNGSLGAPGRWPGVRIRGSRGEPASLVTVRGNTFCTFAGAAPGLMSGVTAGPGAVRILVTDNLFYGCAHGWTDGTGGGDAQASGNRGP